MSFKGFRTVFVRLKKLSVDAWTGCKRVILDVYMHTLYNISVCRLLPYTM